MVKKKKNINIINLLEIGWILKKFLIKNKGIKYDKRWFER